MIDGLCPYAEMRPSGPPWLGDVPAHWDVLRSKYAFREVDSRSTTGEETHLSMSQRLGLVPANQVEKSLVSESYVGAKLVKTDDLVLNRLKAHLGVFAYAKQPGLISPDYTVLRPKPGADVKFFEYVLKSPACRAELRTRAKGIVEGFWRLYTDDFYNIRLPMPPLDEQRLIVRFLDWHGAQTAKLLRAKQSLLNLVAEEREALTQDVVSSPGTQQFRLGNVVDHVFRSVEREGARTYTPVGLYNRGRGIFQKSPTRGDDLGDSTFSWIEEGDLILSGQFAWEGAVALAGTDEAGCIASHRYHILRGKEDLVQTIYLSSVLRTSFGHLLLNEHSRGAAGRNRPLNIRTLLKEKIPVPAPSEQARLVELVTLEKRLAGSIAKFADRLREFRTRLIADIVTGKLDVRAAATGLPETAELEATDDLAEGDDLDEAIDDAENEGVAA